MAFFTDRVPYLGLVDWDDPHIETYAKALAAGHRPRRRWWLLGRQYCRACGTAWPCYAGSWAGGTIDHHRHRTSGGHMSREDRRDVLAVFGTVMFGMVMFVALAVVL